MWKTTWGEWKDESQGWSEGAWYADAERWPHTQSTLKAQQEQTA